MAISLKDWLTPISPVLAAIISGVAGSLLTAKLALKRFYLEKNWESRADAYTKIFIALHNLKNHDDHALALNHLEHKNQGMELSEQRNEVMKDLKEVSLSGIADLRLHIDLGTFVISEQSVELLKTLMSGLDESVATGQTNGYEAYLERRLLVLNKCLEELRKTAHEDLHKSW